MVGKNMARGVKRKHTARYANELEAKLQKEILRDLAKRSAFSFKCLAANKRGIPDIVMCVGGKFVTIELKREVTHPYKLSRASVISDVQKLTADSISANKGMVFYASSFGEYDYIMTTLEKRLVNGKA